MGGRSSVKTALLAGAALMLAAVSGTADTEIYRCALADGTVAFQEMPCAEAESAASPEHAPDRDDDATPADDFFDFENPFDSPQEVVVQPDPALPESLAEDRETCIETTRDAIDAIDLKLQSDDYAEGEGRTYLAELLELTQQLRACKQL